MATLSNFGEQFASKTVQRVYQNALFPVITNRNFEGEIQNAGDRLNILSFPGDAQLGDYVVGTDMDTRTVFDMEDQLIVEKRKFHAFSLDRLENLFTYASDVPDNLTNNVAMAVERTIDTYVLEQVAFARAGSWVGIDVRVVGSSSDTEASVATTATGGTVSVQAIVGSAGNRVASVEHGDGTLDYSGFTTADIGKPIRLTSGTTWATEWYRITAVTDSTTVSVENWDGATAALDIPNGDVLRGLFGASQFTGGATNGDGKPTTQPGWGYELQAARGTALTASTIYEQAVQLGVNLDNNEIPQTDRHITVNPDVVGLLKNASELQPAVSMAYEGVVINGRVGKVAGFDIHSAAGARVSTRIAHSSSTGIGADIVVSDGGRNSQILANHISFCTFGYKWAETRVVEAENQFAKKYQALHLFGAKVPGIMRSAGACLFGAI